MQRQSLGSPGSNHHHAHAGATAVKPPLTVATDPSLDSKRLSFPTTTTTTTPSLAFTDEEKAKLLKSSAALASLKQKKTPERKMIHGIPILTFVCFLILYLSSHDPSQLELDAFGGFKKRLETTTTATTSLTDGSSVGGEAVANGRRRDLRVAEAVAGKMRIRVHRKLGDF